MSTTRNGDGEYFSAIEVDGIIMVDSTTQNLDYGTNGFYLPMDGNLPIGKDQSGKKNDFVNHNFSDIVPLNKATGGLPILNTLSGGRIASVGVRTDANYSSCLLALPLAPNVNQNTTNDVSKQINSASTTKTVTGSNVSTLGDPTNLYNGSFSFNGSNSEIVISSTDFSPGTGPFTIELWFNASSLPNTNNRLLTSGNNTSAGQKSHYQMMVKSNGGVEINWDTGVGYALASAAGLVNINQWHHMAMTRNSDSPAKMQIWLDGKEVASSTSNTGFNSNNTEGIVIGRESTGSNWWNGSIQDVRYYNAVCKYTSDFRVGSPDTPFQPLSPSGTAYSSALTQPTKSNTKGSVAFPKEGSYLQFATSSGDISIGTGDFTIEAYVYHSGTTDDTIISPVSGCTFTYGSSTKLRLYRDGGTNVVDATTDFISNRWVHVAVCRSGSTLAFYQDGKQVGTHSYNYDINDFSNPTYIGKYHSGGSQVWMGFISNLRVVVGTALYDSATYIPPSAPLTNVTGTKLLCCQSNGDAAHYAVSPGAITVVGDAKAARGPYEEDISAVLGEPSNYCTMNPLDSTAILENGNLLMAQKGTWSTSHARGTVAFPSTGKWYYEATQMLSGGGWISQFGFANKAASLTESYGSVPDNSWTFYFGNGREVICPAGNQGSYFGAGTIGLPVGGSAAFAIDMDNGTWQCFREGVGGAVVSFEDSDNANTFSITELYPYVGVYNRSLLVNFGQKPFKFPPPEGFQPLCGAGMESPGLVRPDKYYGTGLYTGNGGTKTITSYNFQPDLVIFKNRETANGMMWIDSVRGATKVLYSHLADGEGTEAQSLQSFDKQGFTMGSFANNNTNNEDYVTWAWHVGGNKNTFNIDDVGYASASDAGLTGADIDPTGASVSTKTGFSIIKYTAAADGARVPHGLGATPDLLITKVTSEGSQNWSVYTNLIDGSYDYGRLNGNQAFTNSGQTAFNATTFPNIHGSGKTVINYLWRSIPGFSKMGVYKANNSTNGPYVSLGFKPALVCIKSGTTGGTARNWALVDSTRSYANVANHTLAWNLNNAESGFGGGESVFGASNKIDLLSDGFKIRDTGNWCNESGATYIYMAWAESPFHNLYGGQSNAR